MSCLHAGRSQERKDLWKWMAIQANGSLGWQNVESVFQKHGDLPHRWHRAPRCWRPAQSSAAVQSTWAGVKTLEYPRFIGVVSSHDRKRQILSPNTFTAILIMQFACWGIWSMKPRGKQQMHIWHSPVLRLKAGSHWPGQSWAKLHWDLL